MDITIIIEIILTLLGMMGLFIANRYLGADKVKRIVTIVETVVAAANELEITGDLVKLGTTKANYALDRAKAMLAKNHITFNEDELLVFIKSAVTKLRIEVAGTNAEKIVEKVA